MHFIEIKVQLTRVFSRLYNTISQFVYLSNTDRDFLSQYTRVTSAAIKSTVLDVPLYFSKLDAY